MADGVLLAVSGTLVGVAVPADDAVEPALLQATSRSASTEKSKTGNHAVRNDVLRGYLARMCILLDIFMFSSFE